LPQVVVLVNAVFVGVVGLVEAVYAVIKSLAKLGTSGLLALVLNLLRDLAALHLGFVNDEIQRTALAWHVAQSTFLGPAAVPHNLTSLFNVTKDFRVTKVANPSRS
jgi:hypothetical protein